MAPASARRKTHTYRGLSLDQRQSERRQKLIRAAVALYGRDGYHGTAIRALCAHAGLTERYFYESFPNSEALLSATYEHLIGELRGRVLEAVLAAPRSLEERARAGIGAFFQTMAEDPAAARIILFEILAVSSAIDALYRRTIEDFETLVRQVVEAFFDTRQIPGLDIGLIAAGLIGTVLLMASRWAMSGYAAPVDRVTDNALAIFNATAHEFQRRLQASRA